MERENSSALKSLVGRVVEESRPNSNYIPGRGPATEVMAARNYYRGFELACTAQSVEEFYRLYRSQVKGFAVPYELKAKALEGAKVAVQLGLSKLTDEQIDRIAINYEGIKNIFTEDQNRILRSRDFESSEEIDRTIKTKYLDFGNRKIKKVRYPNL